MDEIGLNTFILLTIVSFSAACVALWGLSFHLPHRQKPPLNILQSARADIAFLFEKDVLVDTTDAGRQWLDTNPDRVGDWPTLVERLSARFPELTTRVANSSALDQISIGSRDADDSGHITIERWRGFLRLEIHPGAEGSQKPVFDLPAQTALLDELMGLRKITDLSPVACWRQNKNHVITWANSAYTALCDKAYPKAEGAPDTWPPLNLFDTVSNAFPKTVSSRKKLVLKKDDQPLWFDCIAIPTGEDTLYFALDIGPAIAAEVALHEFRQTLSKTFAVLPTGLAIFDRNRILTIFNPALTDLTKLPAEFLSSRPSLYAVLDRLRSEQMIPEPKNYKLWRRQMSRLESQAINGLCEETWLLPSGQTYRFTGHPHPDGAVAFMLEDISSEIALTQQYRGELEMNQAVLNGLDEALAVFSTDGLLMLSNTAYADLWKSDPSTAFGATTIVDATRHWQNLCQPSPVWGDLREFVQTGGERASWSADIQLQDGRSIWCKIIPIASVATLVRFSLKPLNTGLTSLQTDIQTVSGV